MEDDARTLGQSVRLSWKFLRSIHKDTLAVVRALDTVFEKAKWYPTERNRISDDLSNGSDSDAWIIDSLYRIYVPAGNAEGTDKVVAVQIDFNPPECFDEPVCLGIVAWFPDKTSGKSLWRLWYGNESKRLMESLCGKDMPQPIPHAALQRNLMPGASDGLGFLCKLCDLTDLSAVERAFAKPLLDHANLVRADRG